MEDDHAWARINDILDCLYPFGLTDDKEKNAAIYDRAFAKLNASLMPIDDIKEGSLYVEPSSLEVVLTPDDNSKKISSKGKKSKDRRIIWLGQKNKKPLSIKMALI